MKTNIGQSFRAEFTELNIKDAQLREKVGAVIKSLVINHGGSEHQGIVINDGPTKVSPFDEQADIVVTAVTSEKIIFDEMGDISAFYFVDVSTETLVDTLCALEREINDNSIEIEDYSEYNHN